eukprot:TRINITY_DN11889_c0_g1_i5.p1 TRINITY_DN11889_c0_g1~~TRINITY_DN11889_c0_g1_i5.p1  ORF type:complete len:1155 (+),score=258.36 TRINITY_DN11889_c0_g1_i5:48-3512(+)
MASIAMGSIGTYDEDLMENPFYKHLQSKYKKLFEQIAKERFTVFVPRTGSCEQQKLSKDDYESHVFHGNRQEVDSGIGEAQDGYKLLSINGRTVLINGQRLQCDQGYVNSRQVEVLFEETFYNDYDEAYTVACVDQPLSGPVSLSVSLKAPTSYRECFELLFSDTCNKKTEGRVQEHIRLYLENLQAAQSPTPRLFVDLAQALFTKCMQVLLRDTAHRKIARTNQIYMDYLQLSLETYITRVIHSSVFPALAGAYASEDAHINKNVQNLAEVKLKQLGGNPSSIGSLASAIANVNNLAVCPSPLEKLACLRETMDLLVPTEDPEATVMGADELVPALCFVITRSKVLNWLGNIRFIQEYRFSQHRDSMDDYCLTTFEAALEYIKDLDAAAIMPYSAQELNSNPKTSKAAEFFETIVEGQVERVAKALTGNTDVEDQLCHPLCTCDTCVRMIHGAQLDPTAATVFSRDHEGRTALHISSRFGHVEVSQLLLKHGAVVDATDYNNATPLHLACKRDQARCVLLLLVHQASMHAQDNAGNTPLHLCARNGHARSATALMWHNPVELRINQRNYRGDTCLHLAARYGYHSLVESLVKHGANVGIRNNRNETALQCAHSPIIAKALMSAQASKSRNGSARRHTRQRAVSAMPSPDKKKAPQKSQSIDEERRDSLDSQRNKQMRRARPLRRSKRRSNRSSVVSSTGSELSDGDGKVMRVFEAIDEGDLQMLRYYLGMADDSTEACNPLCQCEKCKSKEASSINVNSCNSKGHNLLHVACQRGELEIARWLLGNGADCQQETTLGRTALHYAAQYCHSSIVELLILYGASVQAQDDAGYTPLHSAAANGHTTPSLLLLEHGADPNVQCHRGNTPLHLAAKWDHVDVVKALLKFKADARIRSEGGLIPLQETKNKAIQRLLEAAAAGIDLSLPSHLLVSNVPDPWSAFNGVYHQIGELPVDWAAGLSRGPALSLVDNRPLYQRWAPLPNGDKQPGSIKSEAYLFYHPQPNSWCLAAAVGEDAIAMCQGDQLHPLLLPNHWAVKRADGTFHACGQIRLQAADETSNDASRIATPLSPGQRAPVSAPSFFSDYEASSSKVFQTVLEDIVHVPKDQLLRRTSIHVIRDRSAPRLDLQPSPIKPSTIDSQTVAVEARDVTPVDPPE